MIEFFLDNNRLQAKYNPDNAIQYARKYALNYNTEFINFNDMGGDCTNFVSQCLFYGGLPLTRLWKPYLYSWITVNGLYNYLINNHYAKEVPIDTKYKPGSIIQFFSNTKGYFSHSGIITEALDNNDYLYCCHSYDKLDYPLSFIYPSLYQIFRVVEIIY